MANDDVTLRLGGDAEGAKRATDEASRGLQGLGAAAGGAAPATDAAARGLDAAGEAAEAGGKAFHFGGAEAERLAMSMQMAGLVAPQLQSSLSYLLQAALNPATLGFGAAVLAVQGLMMAFRASAAETDAERQRMAGLVEAYAETVRGLEDVRRLRGEMTTQGASRAVADQLAMREAAGITEEDARAILEAAPEAGREELVRLALAYQGRPAKFADLAPAGLVRRFRGGRRPEESAAWEAAGQLAAAEDPAARLQAIEARGAMDRRRGLGPDAVAQNEMAEQMSAYFRGRGKDISVAEAAERLRLAYGTSRGWAWAPWTVAEAQTTVREFGAGTGRGVRLSGEGASWGYTGIEPGPIINVGMQVFQNNTGQGNRNLLADGKPRGPQE